jgi:hypothetical protein
VTEIAHSSEDTAENSTRLNRWRFEQVVLPAILLVVGLGVFWHAAHHVSYHADEGDYIYTSRYFDYFVVQRDLNNEAWGDNLWTHTQPMLTRYVVGGWLWVRGHNLSTMPQPGSDVPQWLIVEARVPSVILAASCLVLLYWIGYLVAGSVAGVTAAILVLATPIARDHMARVIPEPSLVFFVLLSLWLAMVGMRRSCRGAIPLGWGVAAGVALGLAFQSKLTAVFSIGSFAAWALIVGGTVFWRSRLALRPRVREACQRAGGWLLAIVIALAVFVMTNPHLYPSPLRHTLHKPRHNRCNTYLQSWWQIYGQLLSRAVAAVRQRERELEGCQNRLRLLRGVRLERNDPEPLGRSQLPEPRLWRGIRVGE